MLPRRLTIQGLYSYQGKQTIDFAALTDAGIFGIFGAVGSGKSSILEAIGFALYGKTERLNERENRNYNMMNLKSNELLIDFEFEHYDHSLYRFTVKGKRNSKRFEDVKSLERNAYKLENQEWKPLKSADATFILDLSYENFRRTIIIPQGKFQEFLQLKDSERTRMMMDIFHLEKYDLSDKVKKLEEENNIAIARLEGEYTSLGDSHNEELEIKEKAIVEFNTIAKSLQTELETKEVKLQYLNKLKEQFSQLELYTKDYNTLKELENSFKEKEKTLEAYQQAKYYGEPILSRKNELDKAIESRSNKINALENENEKLNIELQNNQKKWLALQSDFTNIDHWQILSQDYQILLDILQYHDQSNIFKEKIKSGKELIEKEEQAKFLIEKELSEKEHAVKQLKENQPSNIFVFNEIGEWFQQKKILNTEINKVKEEQIKKLERIKNGKLAFENIGFNFENWKEFSHQKKTALTTQLESIQHEKLHLSTKLALQKYAQDLQEGLPCPLCGSTHHPERLVQNGDIDILLNKANQEIAKIQTIQSDLENNISKAIRYESEITSFEDDVKNSDANIIQLQQQFDIHLKSFHWDSFDAENENAFIEKKQIAEQSLQKIKELENKITEIRSQVDKTNYTLNKYQNAITEREAQYQSTIDSIQFLLQKIKVLEKENYSSLQKDAIEKNKLDLENKINWTKKEYEQTKEKIDQLKKQKTIAETSIKSLLEEKQKEKEVLHDTQNQLDQTIAQYQLESEAHIIELIQLKIDTTTEKLAIQNYQHKQLSALEKKQEMEKLLENLSWENEVWENLKNDVDNNKTELEDKQKQIAVLTQTIKNIKEIIIKKKNLETQLKEKQLRKDNIQTMKNLFAGSGFVNFISSVYLKNLCQAANEKFSKLTHNQLHLELSKSNDFLIRDILNDGKTRSVKTLSGGQTFQASLSLALALADSIQYQNKSDQNFFFLDEGFGSLDKDSLSVIYETLKSLRKENRIVGIISHVEDLQQEIPISLLVKNDPNNGSHIELFQS